MTMASKASTCFAFAFGVCFGFGCWALLLVALLMPLPSLCVNRHGVGLAEAAQDFAGGVGAGCAHDPAAGVG